MSVKLLSEHHLEFLSLKRGFAGSSETTIIKMSHCWKSCHCLIIWIQAFYVAGYRAITLGSDFSERHSNRHHMAIGTTSVNAAKFRGIKPRMYINDLL